jgi:hypothetical protein
MLPLLDERSPFQIELVDTDRRAWTCRRRASSQHPALALISLQSIATRNAMIIEAAHAR